MGVKLGECGGQTFQYNTEEIPHQWNHLHCLSEAAADEESSFYFRFE